MMLRRFEMVRKGWTQVEVPGGWLQLILDPETQVKSVAHAIRAQPVSRPGVRKPPLRGRWTGAVHERREDVSRFPRPGSRCFASSFNTRQSCRGPTSVERAGHSVPTVRASRSPVRTVAGRAATVAMTAARCCWQVHKPFRIASRPPDVASEVVRLQNQVAYLQAQMATKGSERVHATVVCPRRQCTGESVEERSSPTRRFRVPNCGGAHSVDHCEAVRHSGRRHHRQRNRGQQVGKFDGRMNRAVENWTSNPSMPSHMVV